MVCLSNLDAITIIPTLKTFPVSSRIMPYTKLISTMRTSAERTVISMTAGTQKFHLDCLPFIFSIDELEVLEKKGHMMKALFEGKLNPVSMEEKSFVEFCKGHTNALSIMETAWIKYLNRHKLEASLFQTEELYQEYSQIRKQ